MSLDLEKMSLENFVHTLNSVGVNAWKMNNPAGLKTIEGKKYAVEAKSERLNISSDMLSNEIQLAEFLKENLFYENKAVFGVYDIQPIDEGIDIKIRYSALIPESGEYYRISGNFMGEDFELNFWDYKKAITHYEHTKRIFSTLFKKLHLSDYVLDDYNYLLNILSGDPKDMHPPQIIDTKGNAVLNFETVSLGTSHIKFEDSVRRLF